MYGGTSSAPQPRVSSTVADFLCHIRRLVSMFVRVCLGAFPCGFACESVCVCSFSIEVRFLDVVHLLQSIYIYIQYINI